MTPKFGTKDSICSRRGSNVICNGMKIGEGENKD